MVGGVVGEESDQPVVEDRLGVQHELVPALHLLELGRGEEDVVDLAGDHPTGERSLGLIDALRGGRARLHRRYRSAPIDASRTTGF